MPNPRRAIHLQRPFPNRISRCPAKPKPEKEPSEREVVISQLNEAAEAEAMVDYELAADRDA